jgi:hypothetical protein
MASATGIEIGPDSYLFTDVRRLRAKEAEIRSVRRFAAAEWPADYDQFVAALRSIRRDHRFSRRAAVVNWSVTDGFGAAVQHDPLASLTAAGFEIISVMSPPQALTRVAATLQRGAPSDAVAWLALNISGASIAIIRHGDLLFSRTLSWNYRDDLDTANAQLLQRYVLISHIAPELDHGFKIVRETHSAPVGLIVTCGSLPELRSLTLPLIEELDVEVETLDSTDGLAAGAKLGGDAFIELAPVLRLASAAALSAGPVSHRGSILSRGSRLAAPAAVVAALAWAGYSFWHGLHPSTARQSAAPQRTPPATSTDRSGSASAQSPSHPIQPSSNPTPVPVATRGSDEPNRATPPVADTPRRSSREQSRTIPSDTQAAAPPHPSSPAGSANEPLPRIDTVLIDQNRRLAILDGAVVGIGDSVGSRVVVAIAREAILLREPSGRIVRVRPRVGM